MSGADETKRAWVLRVLGVDIAGAPTSAPNVANGHDNDAPTQVIAGMPVWEAARADAVAQLKEIAKEIADAKHSESAKAIIELSAVSKQLTAKPATLQQVVELERYLGEDEVVADVCQFALDIRAPLLAALAGLKTGLAATNKAG